MSSIRRPILILTLVILIGSTAHAADLVINTDTTWTEGSYVYDAVTITAGATLTCEGVVSLQAASLTVDTGAAISANGQGWPGQQGPGAGSNQGGGAHGGAGGGNPSAIGGLPYDSATTPAEKGSGGGGGPYNAQGGAGGGALLIDVAGACFIDGELTADGDLADSPGGWDGGGGAGGTIRLTAATMSGGGIVSADGGDAPINGHGGSGGRIFISTATLTFTGGATTTAGSSAAGTHVPAEDGTVGFLDTDDNVFSAGPSWRFQADDGPFVFTDILINSSETGIEPDVSLTATGAFSVTGSSTVDIYGDHATMAVSAHDLLVESGSMITVEAKGWPSEQGPGAGSWMGGGSHGGLGGHTVNSPTGSLYGTALSPTTHGSGGGNGPNGAVGGHGGGAVRLDIEDDCTIDGEISADGESGSNPGVWDGGGGAGGSVYIATGNLSGAGTISADGGPINDRFAGGGGRIVIRFVSSDFTGDIHASGGVPTGTGTPGENGTVGLVDTDDNDLTTGPTWHFQERDTPFEYNNVTIHGSTVLFDEGVGLVARGRVDIDNGALLTGYDRGKFAITARELSLASGCAMDVDLQGWPTDQGPGAGETGAGAGHGGAGGTNGDSAGGSPYGSDVWPVEPGSGGGTGAYTGAGGAGGGTLQLTVTETFTLAGDLTADAGHGDWSGGGGSGGSILVSAGRIEGSGSLTASGGDGGTYAGASGGAGGRIAIRYNDHAFTGSTDIAGGVNGSPGEAGTERWIAAAGLQLDVPLEIDALRGVLYDFPLELVTGQAPNLLVSLTPLDTAGSWTVLARRGAPPTIGVFDWSVSEANVDGELQLLIPSPSAGTLHISVLTTDPDIVDTAPFRILAEALDRHLEPRDLGAFASGARFTTRLAGLGFTDDVTVHLLPMGSASPLASFAPDDWSSTSLTVTLDLTGIAPQDLDLGVEWSDGETLVISRALSVVATAEPTVSAWITGPEAVRTGRTYTVWLEYINNSPFTIPAPQFQISTDIDATFSVLGGRPQHGAIQILGGQYTFDGMVLDGMVEGGDLPDAPPRGATLDDMTLPPGVHRKVPIQVSLPVGVLGTYEYVLDLWIDDGTTIDWASVEDDIRPENMDDETWLRLWPLLQTKIGTSWDDMADTLRSNASYLATLGRAVFNHGSLLQIELNTILGPCPKTQLASAVDAAAPAPGPALTFSRVFPNGLQNRQVLGPLGRGWRHRYDVRVVEHPSGNASVLSLEGSRNFQLELDGSFAAEAPSDLGRLESTPTGYTLQETGGATLVFNVAGLLEWMQDPTGHGLTLVYDPADRLTSISHSSGDALTLTYNAFDHIDTVTDHAGRVTTYTYDPTGEYLTEVVTPGGVTTEYLNNVPGGSPAPTDHALTRITFPSGVELNYEYDVWGRLTAEEKTGGAERVTYSYDDHGRTHVAGENGHLDIWWDEQGRAARARDNLGREIFLTLDEEDNMTTATDDRQASEFVEHDHLGNPTTVTNPLGGSTRVGWTYPAGGGAWLRSMENPVGYRVTLDHTADGRLSRISYPDGSDEQLEVQTVTKSGGRSVEQVVYTRQDGETIAYTLNERGQLSRKDFPDSSFVAYDYDLRGRVQQITDADGATLFTWNGRDLLERIDYPDGHWVENTFNDLGQRTRRVTDDGTVVDSEFDDAGRLERVLVDSAEFISYDYDLDGRLTDEWRANGTHSEYVWDTDARLDSVTHYDSTRAVMAEHAYHYPARSKVPEAIDGPQGRTELTHDARQRLTGVSYPDGLDVEIGYDAADNRNLVIENAAPAAYETNSMGQYTQVGNAAVSWRPDGDLESIIQGADRVDFGTDVEGRLKHVTRSSGEAWNYGHDVFNRQSSITSGGSTRRIVTDPLSPAGRATEWESGQSKVHIPGIGAVGYRQDSGSVRFLHFDGRGNTTMVTDGSGVVVTRIAYRAFGESEVTAGAATTDLRYAGRWGVVDDQSGLLHTAERAMHPKLGRFTSRAGDRAHPRPYQYAADSPIAFRDSTGDGATRGAIDPRPQAYQPAPTFQRSDEAMRIHQALTGGATTGGEPAAPAAPSRPEGPSAPADLPIPDIEVNIDDMLAALNQGLEDTAMSPASILPSGPNGPITGAAGLSGLGGRPGSSGPGGGASGVSPGGGRPGGGGHTGVGPTGPGPGGRTGGRTGGRSGGPGAGAGRSGGAKAPYPPGRRWHRHRIHVVYPVDPNEKMTSPGDGSAHTVQPGVQLAYTIFFENQSSATAPAQEVFVTDQLPAELDWSTFRATEIGWGTTTVPLPENTTVFQSVETADDWRPDVSKQWLVDLSVDPDLATGEVSWTFRTLDPDTGALPVDAYAGFLPPNDSSHRGEGWVSFVCHTHPDLAEGTTIENFGSIVFDLNDAIITPTVFNTIGYPMCDPSGDGLMDAKDLAEMIRVLTEFGYRPTGFADCDHQGGETVADLLWIVDRIHE